MLKKCRVTAGNAVAQKMNGIFNSGMHVITAQWKPPTKATIVTVHIRQNNRVITSNGRCQYPVNAISRMVSWPRNQRTVQRTALVRGGLIATNVESGTVGSG